MRLYTCDEKWELRINLLMEKKFTQLTQFIKAWDKKENGQASSFAADLFKGSGWFFGLSPFGELEKAESVEESVKLDSSVKPVKKPTVSANTYKYKVLFLGDTFGASGEEDLLGKMIQAMKLEKSEYLRFSFDDQLEKVEDFNENLLNPTEASKKLFDLISENNAQVVVTLGATTTSVLTGKRQKLSNIHGQFFPLNLPNYTFSSPIQLVPIFHPDYLKINPNMKKTAWIDLQEVMKVIGKI